MLKVINKLLVVIFVSWIGMPPSFVNAQTTPNLEFLISEVKVRYDSSLGNDYDEYIELQNVSSEPILLANYVLEYFNATNPSPTQQPVQKTISDKLLAPGEKLVLAKQQFQVQNSLPSPYSSLSDAGGRLRLVTIEGEVIDEMAWTNTQALANVSAEPPVLYQCNTSTALCNGNKTQSFSRLMSSDGSYVFEGETWHLSTAQPSSSPLIDPVVVPGDEQQEPDGGDNEQPLTSCIGIVISELQPNPSGSDTGKEFIELHNPTGAMISLENCTLQISGSSRTYAFGPVEMNPGSYIAFYDNVTQLTLPNAAGGTVWLLDSTDEVYQLVYPGGIDDDAAWANVNGSLQVTYQPTPNMVNIAMPLKPCSEGEIRDESNGECRLAAKEVITALTPCKVGQERSPETNRCRKVIASAGITPSPCKQGQERNPETNRCRNVLAASALAPCDDGEERSSETNRCRKVASTVNGKLASVKDVRAPINTSNPTWWLAGIVISLAVGYAVYEWRQEIIALWSRIFSHLRR